MKLKLQPAADRIIGALRVPPAVYDKIKLIANKNEVSLQEVVRAILVETIDTIEV